MRIFTFLFFILFLQNITAQTFSELAEMPEAVANNAVTSATVNGQTYVYSFGGIDATKSCNGDHLRSFRYSVENNTWETIPDIPDILGGKIAIAANTIKNKIYVTGGYHLSSNCGEVSSSKIHVFNPETNEWEADGAPMFKAIDDHVQAVWKDSLLFMVTGWSNTTNVTNVQIYNPSTDEWSVGSAVPNMTVYKVFGGSGTIIGDTLYYAGGARIGSNFAATTSFRKGYINPEDPTDITWSEETNSMSKGYRMGASDFENKAIWFGGSDVTYNFDGIAYNGSGGVAALSRISQYDPNTGDILQEAETMPTVMDLRGVAKISANTYIIAGGMLENQVVSNKTWLITFNGIVPSNIKEITIQNNLNIAPNPTTGALRILENGIFNIHISDATGRLVWEGEMIGGNFVNLTQLNIGVYSLQIFERGELKSVNRLVINR